MERFFRSDQEEEMKMKGEVVVIKKKFPEAICQFCETKAEEPENWDDRYECECGAEYWLEDAGDVAEEEMRAKEEGREIRILEDYDFLEGERVHLVFSRKKDTCYQLL